MLIIPQEKDVYKIHISILEGNKDCHLQIHLRKQLIYYVNPKRQILDSPKLEEFVNNKFRFDENGRKFSKWIENTVGKGELLVTSNFSFSHSVFKILELQTRKNQGLFGKG